MSALDTLPTNGDLEPSFGSVVDLPTLFGGKLQSVTSVVVTPRTGAFGYLGFFVQDAQPAPGDPMPLALTFPIRGRDAFEHRFDPSAVVPSKPGGHLWYVWSKSNLTFDPATGGANPVRSLGLVFNCLLQGSSFFQPRGYSAATASFTPDAASATDVLTITGNSARIIDVLRIEVSFAAAITSLLQVVKRSTANTGGASAAQALVPDDSIQGASLAQVLRYTTSPAPLGTLVGAARSVLGTAAGFGRVFNFAPGSLVVRAATDVVALNCGGVAGLPACTASIYYTEQFADP